MQPEFDATYGMFCAYMWGSNITGGDHIEIDYGWRISPKWRDFTSLRLSRIYLSGRYSIDYFELKTAVACTFNKLDP